jgi:hypothetical protein
MTAKAPRLVVHGLRRFARGAVPAFALVAGIATSAAACSVNPLSKRDVVHSSVIQTPLGVAWYSDLTDRYGHGVLGDALEPTTLHLWTDETSAECGISVKLDAPYVFEDVAPRPVDLDKDGRPELIVVRSHAQKGAQLAVYGQVGDQLELIASTPFIGRANRWLAPVGAADLDGDGHFEIAYVDRPHLAKTLRIWRFQNQTLTSVVDIPGLTNHRIGEDFISGGIRTCDAGPEMVLADSNWRRIIGVQLSTTSVTSRDLGRFSAQALRQELTCP